MSLTIGALKCGRLYPSSLGDQLQSGISAERIEKYLLQSLVAKVPLLPLL